MNGEGWLLTTKLNIEHCIEGHVSGENYPDHLTTIMSHCEEVTPELDCDEIWGRQEIFEKLNKQLMNIISYWVKITSYTASVEILSHTRNMLKP